MNVNIYLHKQDKKPLGYDDIMDVSPQFDKEKNAIYWHLTDWSGKAVTDILSDDIAKINVISMLLNECEEVTIKKIACYIETINAMCDNQIKTNIKHYAKIFFKM